MVASAEDRAARLEALTGALIHRFNNVLMGIQPHVEVIKRSAKDNERVLGSATQIETALRRAKVVMNEISRLARPVPVNAQALDVGAWFETMRRDIQPFATSPVELTFESPGQLSLSGDREQLTRVVANLVANAVEAMPNGGAVTVIARDTGAGMALQVADNGEGMAAEVLGRAFDPLFTTRRNSAGLGLPIVRQIVEAHGGTVRLESEPGRGTTVTIVL